MLKLFNITAQTLHPGSVFFHPGQSRPIKVLSVETKKERTTIEYQEKNNGPIDTLSLPNDAPVKLCMQYTRVNPAYTPVEIAALNLLDSINETGGILTDENDNPVGLGSDPENLDLAVDADALYRALRADDVMEACLLRHRAEPDDFDRDEEE